MQVLGVGLAPLTGETAAKPGYPGLQGLYVARVQPDSFAAGAGLIPGQVITAVDGQPTPTVAALHQGWAKALQAGGTTTLTVHGHDVEVKLR